jgi:histidinol-phosphate aminotransferase
MNALATAQRRTGAIRRYRPGRAANGGDAGKLSSNEHPLGPSPAAVKAICASAPEVHRYVTSDELRLVIAEHEGLDPDRIVVTNGSDELCYLTAMLTTGPGSPVILSEPCYQIDELVTRLHEAEPRYVPLKDGAHDLDAMAEASTGATLCWLPTPHNPTGRAVSALALESFLDRVSDDCVVVLDEAYRPFAGSEFVVDTRDLLDRHSNLLIQRTLSKAHGLAGLRVGYGLGPAELIGMIDAAKPPFNVNAVAVNAAAASLRDPAWADYGVDLVRKERERFEDFLADRGIRHWPSEANFVTLTVEDTDRLQAELARDGIVVRDGSDLGLPGYLRISIGRPPEMAVVRAAIERFQENDNGGASR